MPQLGFTEIGLYISLLQWDDREQRCANVHVRAGADGALSHDAVDWRDDPCIGQIQLCGMQFCLRLLDGR